MDYSNVLLIMDMDGTLLSSTGESAYLSKENQDLIEYFILKGGTFSVASGRNMQNSFHSLNHLEVNFPYSLINGAMTCRHDNKTVISAKQVPAIFIEEAINYCRHNENVAFIIADEYKMYGLNKKTAKVFNHGFHWQMVSEDKIRKVKPMKLALAFDPKEAKHIFDDLMALNGIEHVQLIQSSPYFIEVVAKAASKGSAIKESIHYMEMEGKILVCVGDYLNDTSMLDLADYPFVVRDAHPKLKKQYPVLKSTHDDIIMKEVLKKIDEL